VGSASTCGGEASGDPRTGTLDATAGGVMLQPATLRKSSSPGAGSAACPRRAFLFCGMRTLNLGPRGVAFDDAGVAFEAPGGATAPSGDKRVSGVAAPPASGHAAAKGPDGAAACSTSPGGVWASGVAPPNPESPAPVTVPGLAAAAA